MSFLYLPVNIWPQFPGHYCHMEITELRCARLGQFIQPLEPIHVRVPHQVHPQFKLQAQHCLWLKIRAAGITPSSNLSYIAYRIEEGWHKTHILGLFGLNIHITLTHQANVIYMERSGRNQHRFMLCTHLAQGKTELQRADQPCNLTAWLCVLR
jgi:hypothetical protein